MGRNKRNLARGDLGLVLVLLAVLPSLLFLGCGQKIGKPVETPGGGVSIPDQYALAYEWKNFPGTTDIVVTTGGFVYVAQESTTVAGYKTFSPQRHPLISDLTGLLRPVYLAEGVNEEIYVADVGDTSVKRFSRSGGAPIQVVRDTAWTQIGGIAVDNQGFLYVADRQRELIWKYRPSGERDSSLVHPILGTPGLLTEGGEGLGYVRRPGGMCFDGLYLQVTDTGKNRIQKLITDEFALNVLVVLGPSPSDPFSSPLDSDADADGNVYVADTGKNRVLQYDNSGTLKRTVTWDSTVVIGPPPAVAARDKWVYVADPEHSRILIYELR
ncbi:MAG: NHL repeat-containing protein [Candidatus Eisenbacteria bacterium]|nr:NHL repeat-containing protein [Candidatus Eisenbacteria bacterium]